MIDQNDQAPERDFPPEGTVDTVDTAVVDADDVARRVNPVSVVDVGITRSGELRP